MSDRTLNESSEDIYFPLFSAKMLILQIIDNLRVIIAVCEHKDIVIWEFCVSRIHFGLREASLNVISFSNTIFCRYRFPFQSISIGWSPFYPWLPVSRILLMMKTQTLKDRNHRSPDKTTSIGLKTKKLLQPVPFAYQIPKPFYRRNIQRIRCNFRDFRFWTNKQVDLYQIIDLGGIHKKQILVELDFGLLCHVGAEELTQIVWLLNVLFYIRNIVAIFKPLHQTQTAYTTLIKS